jgi:pimeloyl-ACP methyl ester carboxylesterase
MPTARVNGFKMYYDEIGSGAPVVYVHGGWAGMVTRVDPGDWTWERDFAARFRFIWYDRRGCYRSEAVGHGFDPVTQAGDLEGLLDQLQIGSAHIIGSSAGGPVAMVFAATRPDRVGSLILTGTALDLFPPDHITAAVRERVGVLETLGPEAAYETRPADVVASMEELWRKDDAERRGHPEEFVEFRRRLAARAEAIPYKERVQLFAAELRNLAAYLDLDLRSWARQITAPTLVLHGGADYIVPVAWGERLVRAIPTAQWTVVPSAGHGLWTDTRMLDLSILFIQEHDRLRGPRTIRQ